MDTAQSTSPSSGSPLRWIAFIIVVLVLSTAGFTALRDPQSNGPTDPNQQNQAPTGQAASPIAPNTLVYGTWTNGSSEITAADLSSRKSTSIASLPVAIKKVTVLSPESLLYIDETNTRDHGKQLKVFDIKNKKEKTSIPAASGFGIDDYVVSPNKRYVAIWEVAFANGSEILQGGRSQVYVVDLTNPTQKRLLYNEVAGSDTPIHYPRAVLNDGKVFTDKFIPNDENSGMGWAYGMSVVDFNGNNNKDIDSMAHGTYGTQPFLSPDGKSLVFAGYDGTLGDGKAIRGVVRQALLTPNTVELLDTTTLERTRLENLPNNNIYSSVFWDNLSGNILITLLSKTENQSGLFTYSLSTKALKKITLPDDPQNPYSFIGNATSTISLVGKADDSRASLGNLGEEYAASLTSLFAQDSTTGDLYNIRLNDSLIQYITLLPANYFQNVLGIAHAQGGNPADPNVTIIDLYSDKPTEENLQLKTFLMKPELAPVREKQQSTPERRLPNLPKTISCRDLATEQCLAQGHKEDSPGFRSCHQKAWDANRATKGTPEAICNKSPLYLYGRPGERISVKVQTQVYNDNPSYKGGYNITLQENGKMQVNGQNYTAINYDYRSNLRRITPPTKGTIVNKEGVEEILREYGKKLGLNEKETSDLVASGKRKITSPYAFISFFDHSTSHSILPLSFMPQPDNYLNVVFYFKLLETRPNYSPIPPTFGAQVSRNGLTAIEVSEIVE
jgi:hypothetical protein